MVTQEMDYLKNNNQGATKQKKINDVMQYLLIKIKLIKRNTFWIKHNKEERGSIDYHTDSPIELIENNPVGFFLTLEAVSDV